VLRLHSLAAAVTDAAGAGDFPGAAALLRQVLELQSTALGPDHPDLVSTLKTLALMLERAGDTVDAGRCYRRAHEIAMLAYGPDADSVRLSEANLAAFYREFGSLGGDPGVNIGGLDDFAPQSAPASIHVEASPDAAPPSPVARPSVVAPSRPGTASQNGAAHLPITATPRPWRSPEALLPSGQEREVRLPIFAARGPDEHRSPPMRPLFVPPEPPPSTWRRTAGGMLVLMLGIGLAGVPAWWLRDAEAPLVEPPPAVDTTRAELPPAALTPDVDEEEPPPDALADAPAATGPVPASVQPARAADRQPVTDKVVDDTPVATNGENAADPALAEDASSPTLRVAEAGLCAGLSTGAGPWRCEPSRDAAGGSTMFYYTRVASPRDVLVRHRWSRDGLVVQMVVLRILSNPTSGYRTYSKQSGPSLGPGTWQVALLAPDGRVLDETEFVVR